MDVLSSTLDFKSTLRTHKNMGAKMGAISNSKVSQRFEKTTVTQKTLEALKPVNVGKRLNDGRGMFGIVRALKTGAVSVDFQWRYSFKNKVHQIRVGTWPKLTLKRIRDIRATLEGKVKDGIDPLTEKETIRIDKEAQQLKKQVEATERKQSQLNRIQELAAKQARITVRELFDTWQATDLRNRKDGGKEVLRAFEKDVFPSLGKMAVEDVKKAHIQNIVDKMRTRGVTTLAKHVFGDLRQLFNFATDRDYIPSNPSDRIKKSKIAPSVERDRVLSEAELIEFFKKLPLSGLQKTSVCALLIQLATVTRIGEVLGAVWHDVDLERRRWTLPETKNGIKHVVYLNDLALEQFQELRQLTGLTPWVFPNVRLDGAVDSKSVSKQVSDRQRGDTGPIVGRSKQTDSLKLQGGKWIPHDLRRTGATIMAELGVMPEVIERCLNHKQPDRIKRIYQRAQYEGPMREAWQKLNDRLVLLINPHENIVLFNRVA